MPKHIILGVHLTDRFTEAPEVQKVFTECGCCIKTRLGLHEISDGAGSPKGLIILELFGDEGKCGELAKRLSAISGVEVQQMVFDHA